MGLFERWLMQHRSGTIRKSRKHTLKKKKRPVGTVRGLPTSQINEETASSGRHKIDKKQLGCLQSEENDDKRSGKKRKERLERLENINVDDNAGGQEDGNCESFRSSEKHECAHDGIRPTLPLDGFEHSTSLSLVRSLQCKDVPLERKIELAYRFVESLKHQEQSMNFSFQWEKCWMGMPQLVLFLCDWIQSILISSTNQDTAPRKSTHKDCLPISEILNLRTVPEACLDARCWVVFKWCLQSKYLKQSSFPPKLMRSINFVLTAATVFPGKDRAGHSGSPYVSNESVKPETEMVIEGALMKEFTEVVGCLFSLHGRYFRPTLDLWASSALAAVSLAQRVFSEEVFDDHQASILKLVGLVLEAFAKFLGSHPNPRNVFPIMVEKLLEPLLLLLAALRGEFSSEGYPTNESACVCRIRLLEIIEYVLGNGLFHSVHMDGYLNICIIDRYAETQRSANTKKKSKLAPSKEHEKEDSNTAFTSYHKSLFQKLEHLRREGKTTALYGIGWLLRIFINRKKNQRAVASQFIRTGDLKTSRLSGDSQEILNSDQKELKENSPFAGSSSKASEGITQNSRAYERKRTFSEAEVHSNMQEEVTSKPLFKLFVEFLEPLRQDLENCAGSIHLQESENFQQLLSHALSMVCAVNSLLSVVKNDKIYTPTEDTPEQAQFNFLKKIYCTIFELGATVLTPCLKLALRNGKMVAKGYDNLSGSKQHDANSDFRKLITLVGKDVIHALSLLLEIEYRVAEDELLELWLLLLSYLALDSCGNNEQHDSCMLNSAMVQLGCRILCIYSELRQVDRPLFRLFQSIRFFTFCTTNISIERVHIMFISLIDSLQSTLCIGAVASLVCSQDFLNVVATVIAAVPEGQVAQFIRLLKVDILETLGWMKNPYIKDKVEEPQITEFQSKRKQDSTVQAEVVGKALTELYMLILDKSNVTVNNSIPVGTSVKEMVTSVRPCLSTLVDEAPKHEKSMWQRILSVIIGKKIFKDKTCKAVNMQSTTLVGGSWIMVFIFRLYLSCRSLYRQCISFMPPNPAKKASLAMVDSFTAYSANEWIENGANWAEGGYFSWIGKPSVCIQSMLTTISESLVQDGFGRAAALLYVLHSIALQRLVDLNRQLKALEFLYDKAIRLECATAGSHSVPPIEHKDTKRLEKLLEVSRQEASSLTDFMLNYMFFIIEKDAESESCTVDITDKNRVSAQNSNQDIAWNSVIGTLNEASLVMALWQLLCQNMDVWSCHASKKSMKKFASKLLGSFLSLLKRTSCNVGLRHAEKHIQNDRKLVTLEDTSLELLRNSVLYEQELFCKYLVPKICQKLRRALPSRLNSSLFLGISSSEAVFDDLQDWPKFINMLEEEAGAIRDLESCPYENHGRNEHESTAVAMPVSEVVEEDQAAFAYSERIFGDWINVLNMLCWLPKGYWDVKDLSTLVRHILNIERFLVTIFLKAQQASCSGPSPILKNFGIFNPTEFLQLFLACRRALKSIALSFNEDEFKVRRLSLVPILLESSSSCLWLLRSVDAVAGCFSKCAVLQSATQDVQEGIISSGKHIIFSILNQTAGTLMLICEDLFNVAARSLICHVQPTSGICSVDKRSDTIQISEIETKSERQEYMDIQIYLDVLAKTLSLQAKDMLFLLKRISFETNLGPINSISILKNGFDGTNCATQVSEAGKTDSRSWVGVIALTGGIKSIVWGLASALDNLDEQCRKESTGSLKWQCDLLSKWQESVDGFEYFINFCINKFVVGHVFDDVSVLERDALSGRDSSNASSGQDMDAQPITDYDAAKAMENKFGQEQESKMEVERDEEEQEKLDGYSDGGDDKEDEENDVENDIFVGPKTQFVHDNINTHISKGDGQCSDFFEIPNLNRALLEKMLKGEKPEQATLLGELFMALAGIVKLKHLSSSPKVLMCEKESNATSPEFMHLHIGATCWLISEAAAMVRSSSAFSSGWLVGIVRYLESIGSFIPYMNPEFPRTVYVKLINLHLQAMATLCFSHFGENKSVLPHEVGYRNDNLHSVEVKMHNKASASEMDCDSLSGLKTALRSSFTMLMRKPLEVHLFLALQSIERALAGVWEGCNIVPGIHTGSPNGGKVDSIVAAGVECLDLALESVSGPKRLKLLAKYSSNFVAALINIIVHVHGPHIFFGSNLDHYQDGDYVDPASVILTCMQILSKVASRHLVFPMNAGHVGQLLSFPGVLFQHFYQFKASHCATPWKIFLTSQATDSTKRSLLTEGSFVERKLTIELYVACCRLLCAVLRHRTRESGHCIALLGDSLRVLLFCLETVDLDTSEKMDANFWVVQEGIKCASWLRRVYEEMGQHKDALGRYCSHILSDYICCLSGYGLTKLGLNREIDGALRPGIYALVDSCSSDDLQQMHVVLGEGPRRSALLTLKHDYERLFKYTGKI
eukprot:Gb_18575 [translate_table: standard]